MKILNPFLLSLSLLIAITGFSQKAAQPFAAEIAAFKKQDSAAFPPANAILLIGSSSFRLWKDVSTAFPGHTIVNRAFGGSTLPDLIGYAEEVIFPYNPRQILVYCGDNDLASSDTITPAIVLKRFKTLFDLIREKYKDVPIAFVAIKPSPSRLALMPKAVQTNNMVKQFLAKESNAVFIDVYYPMLNAGGVPEPSLFLADQLHMNSKGYAIWQKEIAPYLIKD